MYSMSSFIVYVGSIIHVYTKHLHLSKIYLLLYNSNEHEEDLVEHINKGKRYHNLFNDNILISVLKFGHSRFL